MGETVAESPGHCRTGSVFIQILSPRSISFRGECFLTYGVQCALILIYESIGGIWGGTAEAPWGSPTIHNVLYECIAHFSRLLFAGLLQFIFFPFRKCSFSGKRPCGNAYTSVIVVLSTAVYKTA